MNRSSVALTALTLLAGPVAFAADLTVEVRGVAEPRGTVVIAVYGNADTWLRRPLKATQVTAATGKVVARLADLPPGPYAVSIFHDQNGNGRLDSNAMRIPMEPYGFSNDAMGMFGPASFEDARFELPAGGARIVIELKG